MNTQEPNWIEITTFPGVYEEQIDVNADTKADANQRYRHRKRAFTGHVVQQWKPGLAPKESER